MSDATAVVAQSDQAPQVDQAQSAFVARLASYSVVNSTWNSVLYGYNAIKEYSPLAKASLEKAEVVGQKAYAAAAPVISSLNDKYKLDEKGVLVLAKSEQTVEGLKAAASDAKSKVVGVVVESKDLAVNTIEAHPRPFNQLLDVTETIVNKLLPAPAAPQEEAAKSQGVIARASTLTTDVSSRTAAKLRAISFRSPQEIAEMTHVVDLIQYAAQYIDVEAQKARLQNALDASKDAYQQVKTAAETKTAEAYNGVKAAADQALEKAQPARKMLEERTADVKDALVRHTVGFVASVAHATEVVRRQIGARTQHLNIDETRADLQRRLAEVIDRTKAYTASLNEAQLKEYIQNVKSQSATAVASLVNLINSSSSTSLRAQLAASLYSWSNSLAGRLGYVIVPVALLDAPAPEPASEASDASILYPASSEESAESQ